MYSTPIAAEAVIRTMRDQFPEGPGAEYVYDPIRIPLPRFRCYLASGLLNMANAIAPPSTRSRVNSPVLAGA